MEDWNISIKHWGNGYCELKAVTESGKTVMANSYDELFRKVQEACEK